MKHVTSESKRVTADASTHLAGIAVSPGVGLGQARWWGRIVDAAADSPPLAECDVGAQLELFNCARQSVLAELHQEIAVVALQLGPNEAAILDSHVSMLNDRALILSVRKSIVDSRKPVTHAIQDVIGDYKRAMSTASSDYLRARVDDIRDVLGRVQRILDGGSPECGADETADDPETPIVLLADELMPSHLTSLRRKNIVAIATSGGGRTSHAAILARALGTPAVSGLGAELGGIANGTPLVVDGRTGSLIVNPTEEATRKYRQESREIGQLTSRLAKSPQGPTQTADGTALQLLANISSVTDAKLAKSAGADGIGLLRTEFYYLSRRCLPDEESEIDAILATANAAPTGPFVARTLDIGGDKSIPYLNHAPEANPFLGWRSIRLSFEHPEMFVQQIRAILQVAAGSDVARDVRLLFPMVTTKTEWRRIKTFVATAREQLVEEGRPCPAAIPMGVMIEVPAAALCIDHFLPEVDFVSIGTNDLVQYLTAADRDNPKVSHLCQALSPAMIRLLCATIGKCNVAKVPVSVCGEMAGSVRAFLPLLGMGLRSFSMSPAFIPAIRDLARHVTIDEAEAILEDVMRLDSAGAIQDALDRHLLHLRAELAALLLG
jgi:phosphotransferase system enzyme I (PtsI)